MPYHVRLSVEGETHDETKLGLGQDALERVVLAPYRTGRPITLNGRTIPIEKINRIRISQSAESEEVLLATVQERRASSSVATLGGPSDQWRAAALATDVTDQFIVGPPGSINKFSSPKESSRSPELRNGASVFVVGGRDNNAVKALSNLIRSMGVRIVEWSHAVARTGVPNPYIGDVVVAGMEMADVTLVVLTPDDVVTLRHDLVKDDDDRQEREHSGQARPNVFYEAGIADALGRQRTVIVEIGRVKGFSDVSGRHIVRLDGSAATQNVLAERLKIAGLELDTSGQDWLATDALSAAIESAKESLRRHTVQRPPSTS